MRPSEVLGDRLLTARGKGVTPKTIGQKRFVDAIRSNTVTFAIGPAGTGKTYLAVATAVQRAAGPAGLAPDPHATGRRGGRAPRVPAGHALREDRPVHASALRRAVRDDRRRDPAAPDGTRHRRGRAAGLHAWKGATARSPGAHTRGFRPIGDLRVGDLVVGSDGLPTPVLGVFPQGREEVFRVTAQDGASTLCSGEHLWAVSTAADRRAGRPGRVLETRAMMGELRAAHAHRFELPLLSEPVACSSRDRCRSTPTRWGCCSATAASRPRRRRRSPRPTRSWRWRSRWRSRASSSCTRIGSTTCCGTRGWPRRRHRREPRHRVAASRSGSPVPGPATKFVPDDYLWNSADVRLAVLQGSARHRRRTGHAGSPFAAGCSTRPPRRDSVTT